MKATLETVTGVTINRDIDTADSPMGIIRKFYEEDATAATQIFSNQKRLISLWTDILMRQSQPLSCSASRVIPSRQTGRQHCVINRQSRKKWHTSRARDRYLHLW